jgi:hypothetical protein
MKKVLLVTEEERNLNRKKRIFIKNRPYRMKITPLGLGDFKKDDESITYRRGNKVWYKAHPEAKLELLYFNGLAIWNYNEFLIDVDYEGKPCRIFFNPISGKFLANEIVYDEEGRVLLKNPTYDKDKVEKMLEIFFDEKTPNNQVKITAAIFKRKFDKRLKGLLKESEMKPEIKPIIKKGWREQYLRDATYWAIVNHKSKGNRTEPFSQVIERAYLHCKELTTSKGAFKGAIYKLRKEVRNAWTIELNSSGIKVDSTEREDTLGNKNINSAYRKFIKKYLKASRNISKVKA